MAEKTSSVEFLIKAMSERAPGKRRVKPVEKHLMSLDFAGIGDSSDDSDYEVPEEKKDIASDQSEDLSSIGSESDGDDGSSSSDDSSCDDPEDEDDGGDDGGGVPQGEDMESSAEVKTLQDYDEDQNIRIRICAVCLGEACESNFDVVSCDCCDISVHEGCYGVQNDALSVHSNDSLCSTEPWFCDSCKAGVYRPACELCPYIGGAYKETDQRRWVHLVCALYTPGVAFDHPDQLSNVTLYEMPYSKWGFKVCSLCDDVQYSNTGVCISCDAGMCRNFFHVTCAQRNGLLSEASDVDIADPFFAYCKQHANKVTSRTKRKNWMALQGVCKKSQQLNSERIQRKLKEHRQKYEELQNNRPDCWVFPEKTPRLLQSSASAVRHLTKKAQLLGLNTDLQFSAPSASEISRKWNLPPSLSPDFAMYYIDRGSRIDVMRKNGKELLQEQQQYERQAKSLRLTYDKSLADVKQMERLCNDLREQGQTLYNMLNELSTKQKFSVPAIIQPPKKHSKSPRRRTISADAPLSSVINKCGLCHLTSNQHELVKCDKCSQHYHLGCLDPPLTRMPKKTKQCGWQCSECTPDSDSNASSDENVDTNAPRRLRAIIKEPAKYTPREIVPRSKTPRSNSDRSRRQNAQREVLSKYSAFKRAKQSNSPTRSRTIASRPSPSRAAPPATAPIIKPKRRKTAQKFIENIQAQHGSTDMSRGIVVIEDEPPAKKPANKPANKPVNKPVNKSVVKAAPKRRMKNVVMKSILKEHVDVPSDASDDIVVVEIDEASNKTNVRRAKASEMSLTPKFTIKTQPSGKEVPHMVHNTDLKVIKVPGPSMNVSGCSPAGASTVGDASTSPRATSSKSRPDSYKHTLIPVKKKTPVVLICAICEENGDYKSTVKCDECLKDFHFHCLDPPCKKNPKTSGYSWFCSTCDPIAIDSSDDNCSSNEMVMEGCDETPMLFDMTSQMIDEYEQALSTIQQREREDTPDHDSDGNAAHVELPGSFRLVDSSVPIEIDDSP